MAEGLVNALYGDRYDAYSAGIHPAEVNPYAIRVMREMGVDLSTYRSKSIEEFRGRNFNYVVTVCDQAKEVCPFFPGEKILHRSFPDPSTFKGSEDQILADVRKVRDEIKKWIEQTFAR